MRDKAEVGELAAKIFDRLETQFPNGKVMDAILLVEISDDEDTVNIEDGTAEGRDVPATIVLLESTSDRLVVQAGIVEFAQRTLGGEAE